MVEIKYFKQFLLLFFSFQLFCFSGGGCKLLTGLWADCNCKESEWKEHTWNTHAHQQLYLHTSEVLRGAFREGGTKSEACNCMFKASSRAKMQFEIPKPAAQNRAAIRLHWCIKSVEIFGEYWVMYRRSCVLSVHFACLCVRRNMCVQVQLRGWVF